MGNETFYGDGLACIVQIVVKYPHLHFVAKRINGSCTKTSDFLKEDSVLLKVFSGLPKVILKVLKDQ